MRLNNSDKIRLRADEIIESKLTLESDIREFNDGVNELIGLVNSV